MFNLAYEPFFTLSFDTARRAAPVLKNKSVIHFHFRIITFINIIESTNGFFSTKLHLFRVTATDIFDFEIGKFEKLV